MLKKDQQVGEYILVERLGTGGFGDVWKAEKRTVLSTSLFAVKFFRANNEEEIDIETVRKEVEIWQRVSGLPHVISVIEANKFEDYVYIVSEFADGGSLDKWIRANGGKAGSHGEAVAIISQILQGLESMHSEGFVHRDLKPANVLLKRNILFLADFGISRQMKTHSKTTGTAGTYDYMPPEAFEGKPVVSAHTDIWAAGVILQKLLTGVMPFPQKELPSLMGAIIMHDPEPLPEDVPFGLRKIVKRALEKRREDRFQTAREMREALNTALTNSQQIRETRRDSVETISEKEFETISPQKKEQHWRETEANKQLQPETEIPPSLKKTEEMPGFLEEFETKRRQAEFTRFDGKLKENQQPATAKNYAEINSKSDVSNQGFLGKVIGIIVLLVFIGFVVTFIISFMNEVSPATINQPANFRVNKPANSTPPTSNNSNTFKN